MRAIPSFRQRVRSRKTFRRVFMGVRMLFKFDAAVCQRENVDGMADVGEGIVLLDSDLSDPSLLETALHEAIEVLSHRLEWNLKHSSVSQLSVFMRSVLDRDDSEPIQRKE